MRAVLILAALLSTATFSAAQTQPDRSGPSGREQRYQMFQDYLIRRAREVTLAQPTHDDVFLRTTGHHIESTDAQNQRALGSPS